MDTQTKTRVLLITKKETGWSRNGWPSTWALLILGNQLLLGPPWMNFTSGMDAWAHTKYGNSTFRGQHMMHSALWQMWTMIQIPWANYLSEFGVWFSLIPSQTRASHSTLWINVVTRYTIYMYPNTLGALHFTCLWQVIMLHTCRIQSSSHVCLSPRSQRQDLRTQLSLPLFSSNQSYDLFFNGDLWVNCCKQPYCSNKMPTVSRCRNRYVMMSISLMRSSSLALFVAHEDGLLYIQHRTSRPMW